MTPTGQVEPAAKSNDPHSRGSMSVSTRDRASASLTATLILVGLVVSLLFVLWLTSRVWIRHAPVAPELIEPLASGGSAMGNARDLVEPGEEEIDDFAEPRLEETIDSITDAVTDQLATLDTQGGDASTSTIGGGAGDPRMPGPDEGDAILVPRWQRWQVEFSATSSSLYVKQLDAFGIELAAAGGGNSNIDYVAKLSAPKPIRRSAEAEHEDRLYMTYKFGPLKALDQRLLESVGVRTNSRIWMQFYPKNTENLLAQVEKQYMDEHRRELAQIETTTFGVSVDSGQYGFYVKEQVLRR